MMVRFLACLLGNKQTNVARTFLSGKGYRTRTAGGAATGAPEWKALCLARSPGIDTPPIDAGTVSERHNRKEI